MNHEVQLSEFQRGNLNLMIRFLWNLPAERFGMRVFSADDPHIEREYPHNCGTVGCVVGHAPGLGISSRDGESWWQYAERVFGFRDFSAEFNWCFGSCWHMVDDTPRGAAKRILYLLRHGLPAGWQQQYYGSATPSYLDEPLDLPDLAPSRLACVGQCVGFDERIAK